jgi:chemotaxis protein MotB
MARTNAWDDVDVGNFGRSRSGSWKTVLVLLMLIGMGTFVAAYYLPLYRAHAALTAQHRAMSGKAQSAAVALKQAQTDLAAAREKRDELERDRFQRESGKKSELSKLELVKASVTTKLEKYTSKGQAVVELVDGRLFVSLPESLVFTAHKAEVTARGKSVLCDVAKSTVQQQLRVNSVAADASAPEEFKSIWAYTSARSASVADTLAEACGIASSRLIAAGYGNVQPADAPKDAAQKFPARVDIEIRQ